VFENPAIQAAGILAFGGEPTAERIVEQDSFLAISTAEVAAAYKDFFNSKYRKILYANDK
jgi:redox-sensitive bicupin YhaK (pirin superfamily)